VSNSPSIYLQVTNWLKSKLFSGNSEVSSSSRRVLSLTQEERDRLIEEFGNLQKQNMVLQQSLREQQTQATAYTEDLFLELLEVIDALEDLLNYLNNNPEPNPEIFHRLPRSVGAVHRKFLSVIGKRQVVPIELQGNQPDFNFCRVVDREVRNDLEEQTITKIVRQGFTMGEKVLRPTEIITSYKQEPEITTQEPEHSDNEGMEFQ
jgi:molecular chaperone GrpE